MASRQLYPFTPSREAPVRLSQRTVGRESILDALEHRLIEAASSGRRSHALLVGPPGSGKTHLLSVAIHRAGQRQQIAGRLAVVRLDEDLVGISRQPDLLAEVLAQLTGNRSHRFGRPDQPTEAIAVALAGRLLVLVIDNLDRLCSALGPAGQQELAGWLASFEPVLLLASAERPPDELTLPASTESYQLDGLELADCRRLLIAIADEAGDAGLAGFLGSELGWCRLRALIELIGGAPRSWLLLAERLTVQRLDDLIPAVEALIEAQVPHYRQLLAGLSPVEQRLVRVLADGPRQAATVAELAGSAAVSQRVAATTLGRLAEAGWVIAEKAPELDQRLTWYRLREPLLRHHLHHRSASQQPLPQIVQLLRAWYDQRDPNRVRVGRAGERQFDPVALAEPAAALADARRWVEDQDPGLDAAEAMALIELILLSLREDWPGAAQLVDRGQLGSATLAVARRLVTCAHEQDQLEDRFGALLRQAATETNRHTHAVLELLSACWDGALDPDLAQRRLAALVDAGYGERGAFGTNLRQALDSWTGRLTLRRLLDKPKGPADPDEPDESDNPDDSAAGEHSELELTGLLRAAVDGSAEALVRLPSELVAIVRAVRAERG